MASHERLGMNDSNFIRIDVAARMLNRSVGTLRKWSQGKPPKLQAHRDKITKFRWFLKKDVQALLPKAEA